MARETTVITKYSCDLCGKERELSDMRYLYGAPDAGNFSSSGRGRQVDVCFSCINGSSSLRKLFDLI